MNRLHPFDYAFAQLVDDQFQAIRSALPTAEPDLTALAGIPPTHGVLQDIGVSDLGEQEPEAVTEYVTALFAAYRFWSAGQRTLAVDKQALSDTIARMPASPAPVPEGACYVQFPIQWFWAAVGEGAPYEPLDGVFVVRSESNPVFTVVGVLGLRPDRDGFSQISVSFDVEHVTAAASTMRDPPFAPVMDGATTVGFRSIVSPGELLYLAHLALHSVTD